ncbi:MAG: putative ABC transporter permease subunit [Patescibacteria group bacterium]
MNLREILLIWRAWAAGVKNTLLRGRGGRRRGGLAGPAAIAAVGCMVFYGMSRFLSLVRGNLAGVPQAASIWRVFCLNLATALALASLIFLFMTALSNVMAVLLEGRGLEFLMAQPLRAGAVFTAKFGESLAGMMAALAPMILPSWLALGAANGAGAGFYLMVVLSLAGGGVLFLAPVTILLLLVMRYIARQRVRQFVVSLSLGAGLLFVFGTQFLNSMAARTGLGGRAWLETLAAWSLAKVSYLPHAWMARAPFAALGWPGLSLAATALPLGLTALCFFLLALALARRIFLAGWSAAQESHGVKGGKRRRRATMRARRRRGSPLLGLLRKDFTLAGREPLFWYNLAVTVMVVGFFAWNISFGGWDRSGPPPAWLVVFYAGLIAFSTMGWNSQFGGIAVSREGGSWWLLQIAPERAERIYAAKLIYALAPPLCLIFLANLALALLARAPGHSFWPSLSIGAGLTAAITSLSLLFDTLSPNFHQRSEGRWGGGRNASGGRVALTTLLGICVVAAMGATLALPAYIRMPGAGVPGGGPARLLGAAFFAAEALAALCLSWFLGVSRLRSLVAGSN